MSCIKCGKSVCFCEKVISKQGLRGPRGPQGPPGKDATPVSDGITVKSLSTTVNNVTELRFTDANAIVTNLGGGVAEVKFTPPATVWSDIQNLAWYMTGSESFKPQYTIEGNRISFRGLLFIPLSNGGTSLNVFGSNSYLSIPSATTDDTRLSIISNANNNSGTPQGRFMTNNVTSAKNFPTLAIPLNRDIVFNNVVCSRRYTGNGYVTNYRSLVSIRIGSATTVYQNSGNQGTGCLMVFSPFNEEFDGAGTPPIGNDPLALQISRATVSVLAADYIASTDDNPFTIPASAGINPFSVNAHNISSLGGFVINLENLSGFLN